MLEKFLNIQDCLEKSLKIKIALKSTGKTLNGVEITEFYHLQEYSTLSLVGLPRLQNFVNVYTSSRDRNDSVYTQLPYWFVFVIADR